MITYEQTITNYTISKGESLYPFILYSTYTFLYFSILFYMALVYYIIRSIQVLGRCQGDNNGMEFGSFGNLLPFPQFYWIGNFCSNLDGLLLVLSWADCGNPQSLKAFGAIRGTLTHQTALHCHNNGLRLSIKTKFPRFLSNKPSLRWS